MAQAAEGHYEDHYADRNLQGMAITRYGHALPTRTIEVVEAGHPVPDEAGVTATLRALDSLRGLDPDDLLLCLISGGASALLCAPHGVTLEQKAELTRTLLASGATISEINCVRKHLSRVKGGRLAAATSASVVGLIVSDVVGDDLASIGSGPTAPDPTTFAEALEILDRYGVAAGAAYSHLEAGKSGAHRETPKPRDPLFDRVDNRLVAGNQQSLEAAAAVIEKHGLTPHVLSSTVEGEAREVACVHAAIVRQVRQHGQPFARPCALISGGETTVTVRGSGRGGRNSEFLLALAIELCDLPGVYALAADTDGIDGSEDNAGAIYDVAAFHRVQVAEARRLLANNDSYTFFERAERLFTTGPTRTNVNDLRIVIIE